MSTTETYPATRLICFGGARKLTNSPDGKLVPEQDPIDKFD